MGCEATRKRRIATFSYLVKQAHLKNKVIRTKSNVNNFFWYVYVWNHKIMKHCPMKISNTAFKSWDFILFKFVKYNVVTEELIPENFSIQYKLAKFFSIFGFVKFHSKSQSISFSLRMNTKSICRPSCNKIVAKCLV